MAEGWGKYLKGSQFNFYSAGTQKHRPDPNAVKVMDEVGIDISHHQSKTIDELPSIKMDIVFTVCSDAHQSCPLFPGGKVIHLGFDDPPRLAKDIDDENEILQVYRRVRDEIKQFIIKIEYYLKKEEEGGSFGM